MFERLLRSATRTGLRRGLGGSGPWLAVGTAAASLRLVRHLVRAGREVKAVEELAPGQTLVITHLAEPS